MSEQQSVPKRK